MRLKVPAHRRSDLHSCQEPQPSEQKQAANPQARHSGAGGSSEPGDALLSKSLSKSLHDAASKSQFFHSMHLALAWLILGIFECRHAL